MDSSYNYWLVALSVGVAVLVSYTALRLAAMVADSGRAAKYLWLTAGAVAMGVGIWSMHFIGMLAFSLPVALTYNIPTTLISLLISVLTSGFALAITSGERLTARAHLGGRAGDGRGHMRHALHRHGGDHHGSRHRL